MTAERTLIYKQFIEIFPVDVPEKRLNCDRYLPHMIGWLHVYFRNRRYGTFSNKDLVSSVVKFINKYFSTERPHRSTASLVHVLKQNSQLLEHTTNKFSAFIPALVDLCICPRKITTLKNITDLLNKNYDKLGKESTDILPCYGSGVLFFRGQGKIENGKIVTINNIEALRVIHSTHLNAPNIFPFDRVSLLDWNHEFGPQFATNDIPINSLYHWSDPPLKQSVQIVFKTDLELIKQVISPDKSIIRYVADMLPALSQKINIGGNPSVYSPKFKSGNVERQQEVAKVNFQPSREQLARIQEEKKNLTATESSGTVNSKLSSYY